MRYKRLVLEGFVPLSLNGVHRFEFSPESDEQIVLGANGSAKSSTLAEFSPLPAIKANYKTGGRKEFYCEDKGIEYTLISEINTSGGKHTFIRDGETLNDAGTAQVQTALVKQHFGYDAEVHELMSDEVKFTRMGPTQRQHWITKISGADFKYAMELWKRLKSDHRDAQGALKNVNQKLSEFADEADNVSSEIKTVEEERDSAIKELDALNKANPKNAPSYVDAANAADEAAEKIAKKFRMVAGGLLNKIRHLKKEHSDIDFSEIETLDDALTEKVRRAVSSVEQAKNTLKGRKEEYERIAGIVEQFEEMGTGGLQSAKDNIVELEKKEQELVGAIREWEVNNPLQAKAQTLSVLQPLRAWLSSLPANPDEKYSTGKLNALVKSRSDEQEKQAKVKSVLARIEERISHIKEAKEEKCPKCDYVYVPGVSENELATLEAKRTQGQEMVAQSKKEIDELDEAIEEMEEYFSVARQFNGFREGHPLLFPLWEKMAKSPAIRDAPPTLQLMVADWTADVETSISLEDTRRRLRDNREAVEKLSAIELPEGGYEGLSAGVQEAIAEAVDQVEASEEQAKSVQADAEFIRKCLDFMNEARKDLEALSEIRQSISDAIRSQYLSEDVDHHYKWIGELYDQIKELQSRSDLIDTYKSERSRLEKEVASLNLLVEEISPKSGLIADVIFRFIDELVDNMNDVVKSVWTYDLKVVATGISESGSDLDYKFPLKVRSNPRPVKDVAMGSSGQEDIINFAFKVVALNLMGMDDYPLILDELAPQLDEQHRINITQYVSKMISSNRCSQIFMVSHFQAGHGAFANAQYCVMDPTNITLPAVYNEHVRFD